MNILQLNVRLTEGGAAQVALDLHLNIPADSAFGYGYSKGANRHPDETHLRAFRLSAKPQVFINYISHKIINRDILAPTLQHKRRLIGAIAKSDVVHIHVTHSYYINLEWLVSALLASGKPVVWTCHDHWVVTGRCAFTDGCDRWKNTETPCHACPSKENYPPVFFDRARSIVVGKRAAIASLANRKNFCFIVPSEHLAEDVRLIYPKAKIKVINNSAKITNSSPPLKISTLGAGHEVKALVIAHDLSYGAKTNRPVIEKVIKIPGLSLQTVGKYSVFDQKNVENFGYISDKATLDRVFQDSHFMLFTSRVDNYPLVVIESLLLGIPVLALKSPAAAEILGRVGGRCAESEDELIDAIKNRDWIETFYGGRSLLEIQTMAKRYFSKDRMINEHMSVYKELAAIEI